MIGDVALALDIYVKFCFCGQRPQIVNIKTAMFNICLKLCDKEIGKHD